MKVSLMATTKLEKFTFLSCHATLSSLAFAMLWAYLVQN